MIALQIFMKIRNSKIRIPIFIFNMQTFLVCKVLINSQEIRVINQHLTYIYMYINCQAPDYS